jgi:shikimate dehydrogenase
MLRDFSVVMDIVYAPLETRLLKESNDAGCRAVNGLAMLLYQGVAQFELWTAQEAPVDIMRDALLAGINLTTTMTSSRNQP